MYSWFEGILKETLTWTKIRIFSSLHHSCSKERRENLSWGLFFRDQPAIFWRPGVTTRLTPLIGDTLSQPTEIVGMLRALFVHSLHLHNNILFRLPNLRTVKISKDDFPQESSLQRQEDRGPKKDNKDDDWDSLISDSQDSLFLQISSQVKNTFQL